MLVSFENLIDLFSILKTASENEKPIYIFASLDCDSVCTTKILTSICKQTGCRYTINPVRGYSDLEGKLKEIRAKIADKEIENIMFINCLGTDNAIKETFGLEVREEDFPDLHLFVFDFHKPVHLTNIYSPRMVWVVDTEEQCQATFPERYKVDDESESESESDSEFSDSDDEGPPRKKRKLNPEVQIQRQKLKKENDEYYNMTYQGLNSSWFMYQMATRINKDDNMMLWCAIVGLTKMFLNQKMGRQKYNEIMEEFQTYVLRRNNPVVEDEEEEKNAQKVKEKRKRDHIQFSNELQLFLLHHWTIRNSMIYSPIVAAKLKLYQDRQIQHIDYILAKMAIPQKEATEKWESMDLTVQKEFYERFKKQATEHFGEDILYGSFTKQHGDHDHLRASDMGFALSALLEDEEILRDVEEEDEVYKVLEENFKSSMDALEPQNVRQLQLGLSRAKNLQQTTADKALDIIQKNRISSIGFFRYCEIDEKNKFYTPLAISSLALFVQNTYTERMRQSKRAAKPLVLGAWNDINNTYTVCGIPETTVRRKLNKNPFGKAFKQAAQRVEARVRNITFETYLIEIQKDDWKKFLDYLQQISIL